MRGLVTAIHLHTLLQRDPRTEGHVLKPDMDGKQTNEYSTQERDTDDRS